MRKRPIYKTSGRVWLYPGMAGWHFVSVDKKSSVDIKKKFGGSGRGFGSIPVNVTVGKKSWQTSIFPDKKSKTYLLPIKLEVRKKENIFAEKRISYSIEIAL